MGSVRYSSDSSEVVHSELVTGGKLGWFTLRNGIGKSRRPSKNSQRGRPFNQVRLLNDPDFCLRSLTLSPSRSWTENSAVFGTLTVVRYCEQRSSCRKLLHMKIWEVSYSILKMAGKHFFQVDDNFRRLISFRWCVLVIDSSAINCSLTLDRELQRSVSAIALLMNWNSRHCGKDSQSHCSPVLFLKNATIDYLNFSHIFLFEITWIQS